MAQILAFHEALARYTVGVGHGLGLLHVQWHPPVPALLLMGTFTVAVMLWTAWLLQPALARRDSA